eukprot:TRINITY_DN3205_c0_g1_i1.p1 TRINITY_DN3205_c0_g1~~TRINITY_DN3205_c0_g1_i1.p1  ORF type:complete len:415 (-),score=148.22 TRINITY_DN3205_c0_g1_i1:45-1289(-)
MKIMTSDSTSDRLRLLKLQRQKRLFHHLKAESEDDAAPVPPRTPKRAAPAASAVSGSPAGGSAKRPRKSTAASANESGLPGPGDLKQNIYVERQRARLSEEETDELRCSCVQPGGWRVSGQPACLEQCFNRLVHIECVRGACLAGEDCNNQRFQRSQWARVQKFATNDGRGWGLRTLDALRAGQFVIEYCGEVVSRDLCNDRLREMAERRERNFYFLSLDGDECIDARSRGNNARYINHSCNPNCETQKWQVCGEQRVGIFALRDVAAGTELTFDYQFERFGSEKVRCLCHEPNCRGFLGEKPRQMPAGAALDKQRVERRIPELTRRRGAEAVSPGDYLAMLEQQDEQPQTRRRPLLHGRASSAAIRHGYSVRRKTISAGAKVVRPVRTHLVRNIARTRARWLRIYAKFADRFG